MFWKTTQSLILCWYAQRISESKIPISQGSTIHTANQLISAN